MKTLLMAFCFCLLTTFAFNAQAALIDNLVSYWTLDEGSGDAIDAHSDNDGTVVGSPHGGTGILNGCYDFNGTTEYVNLDAHIADFASLAVGSVSIWFKYTNDTGNRVLFAASDKGDASSNFYIVYNDFYDAIDYEIREAGTYIVIATLPDSYADGAWHHYVVTVDATGNKHYIDGSPVTPTWNQGASSTQAFFSSINNLDGMRIANNEDSGGNQYEYDGEIDELGVWSRVLSAAEVSSLWNDGNGLAYPFGVTVGQVIIISKKEKENKDL